MIGQALAQAAHDLLIGLIVATAFSALVAIVLVAGAELYRRWYRRFLADFQAHAEAAQREARETFDPPLRVIGGGSRGPDQRAAS